MLPSRTPISTLPSEIMRLIFQRAVDEPAYWGGAESLIDHEFEHAIRAAFSKQPELLTLVCSRWRTIALSCPMLWTHIELSANRCALPTLLAGAELRMERSGGLPLELFIDDAKVQYSHYDFEYDYKALKQVLVRVARRMSTFKFIIYQKDLGPFHSGVLEYIICACSPDRFKKLTIIEKEGPQTPHSDGGRLVLARNETSPRTPWGSQRNTLQLPLPKQEFDNVLSGLETLHLRGTFINWTNAGYRGLVDLRLTAPYMDCLCYIPESALISILVASPRLRVLYISLELRRPSSGNSTPVPLLDLEVLRIFAHSPDPIESPEHPNTKAFSMLRLIAPGSKPLQLTLAIGHRYYGYDKSCFDSIHTEEFFRRSKVEKLCVQNEILLVDRLFCPGYAPDLKMLVTSHCTIDFQGTTSPNWTSNLHSWYLHECIIDYLQLPQMVTMWPVGLVFAKCFVKRETYDGKTTYLTTKEILLAFPTVRFLTDTGNIKLFLDGESSIVE